MTTEERQQELQELFKTLLKLRPSNSELLEIATDIVLLQKAALAKLWEQGMSEGEIAFLMTELPESNIEVNAIVKKLWNIRRKRTPEIKKIIEEMREIAENNPP